MRQPRRDTMLSERDALLEMAAWESQLVRAYAAAIAETESRPLARELLALEGEQAETRLFLAEQLRARGYARQRLVPCEEIRKRAHALWLRCAAYPNYLRESAGFWIRLPRKQRLQPLRVRTSS